MKPLHLQLLFLIFLLLVSTSSSTSLAQGHKGSGQRGSASTSPEVSEEIQKVLFRRILLDLTADSTLGPLPRLVFLKVSKEVTREAITPSRQVAESLTDLNAVILDQTEFSWSDSLGVWLRKSTNEIGYMCHVAILKWRSATQCEAEVGYHFGEDSGRSHSVLLQRTKTGWIITRSYNYKVY